MSEGRIAVAVVRLVLGMSSPACIFISGILTSAAVNQLTSDPPVTDARFTLLGLGDFTGAQVSQSASWSLLFMGAGLFVLGTLCDQATRLADFVRSDHTTQIEYKAIAEGYMLARLPVLVISIAAITGFALWAIGALWALQAA